MEKVCNDCGLPDELCVCTEIGGDESELRISVEERSHGKPVTCISGFDDSFNVDELSSNLKSLFACGGTISESEDGCTIELQGDHTGDGLVDELEERGLEVSETSQ